jgi:hypothetical protein
MTNESQAAFRQAHDFAGLIRRATEHFSAR